MLKKAISVALLSGFIAGLFVTVIQSVLVTPLILEAESYEQSASAFRLPDSGEKPWRLVGHEWKHDEGDDSAEWFPDEGLERTFYTAGSNIVTGVAFALVLVGVFLLRGKPVDLNQGFLWGAAGFVVFSAAPALGLPPELPGMTAATLGSRQLWWFGTVFVTAIGLGIFIEKSSLWPRLVALLLIASPHLIGAPHVVVTKSVVPAELSAQFAVSSLISSALFWMVLGGVSGYFYQRLMPSAEVQPQPAA